MVWTDDASVARNSLEHGRNTLIYGSSGAGKTTILHQIEWALRAADRPVVFAGLRGVEDIANVAGAIVRSGLELEVIREGDLAPTRDPNIFDRTTTLQRVRDLDMFPSGTVVLLDDVTAAVGHALFGRLRDELWQLPLVWGVAVHEDEVGALLTPPADAFFDTKVGLRPMGPLHRATVVAKRGDGLTDRQIKQIGAAAPGNPRQLLRYAAQVVEDGADVQWLMRASVARRAKAEAAAGRDGATLTAEMENLGPVSASDEALTSRMGWPRPRIATTLNRLEEAGVATSFLEPRDGRTGRPRKLYELRPAAEFVA